MTIYIFHLRSDIDYRFGVLAENIFHNKTYLYDEISR